MAKGIHYRMIPGYPGYLVGDDGTVWSCFKGRFGFSPKWRQLTGSISKALGYRMVFLKGEFHDSPTRMVHIHRLVLEAFVGPCPAKMEACHNDGVRLNNRLSNLRWDTRSANVKDAYRHGTKPRKMTNEKLSTILALKASGKGCVLIGREVELSKSTICRVLRSLSDNADARISLNLFANPAATFTATPNRVTRC